MPFGTACARLRKQLLFGLAQKLDADVCVRCGALIVSVDDFTIEHLKPWFDVDADLFWDLTNIAFSHAACNLPHRRRQPSGEHGRPSTYRHGCRCAACRDWKRGDNLKSRE